jgi:PadR family transcriptional regulator, regulatory protein PadR
MRRAPGVLLPIEEAILGAGLRLRREGADDFHGFAMAKQLSTLGDTRKLTAHGTLYKALDRLERAGLLESRWEDPEAAAAEGRPRRRLYSVTGAGVTAFTTAATARQSTAPANPKLATP